MSDSTRLDGKVALVTGSAVRIGAEIVRELHRCGADVVIHYRASSSAAESLAEALNDVRIDSAMTLQGNLLDTASIEPLINTVAEWKRRLDIVVNNASSFYPTPIGTITEAHWDDLIGSNLKAPLFIAQAATPYLQAVNGNLINIVDIHAQQPLKHHLVYGPAKAGLAMLTRALAKELGPDIRVNGVSPGAILWPTGEVSDDAKAAELQQIPLGRTGEPRDIACCVRFLLTEGRYINGQVVAVDGGRSAGW
ncbi:MAG: pteridine reductase [Pseudomonadota bacterium]